MPPIWWWLRADSGRIGSRGQDPAAPGGQAAICRLSAGLGGPSRRWSCSTADRQNPDNIDPADMAPTDNRDGVLWVAPRLEPATFRPHAKLPGGRGAPEYRVPLGPGANNPSEFGGRSALKQTPWGVLEQQENPRTCDRRSSTA